MIGRSERFLEPGGTISSNRYQSVSQAFALLATNAVETLTNRSCHGERDRFTGTLRKLSCETLRLFIFDAEAHFLEALSLERNIPARCNRGHQIGGAPG